MNEFKAPLETRLSGDDILIWGQVAPKWMESESRYYDRLDAIAMRAGRSAFAGLNDEDLA